MKFEAILDLFYYMQQVLHLLFQRHRKPPYQPKNQVEHSSKRFQPQLSSQSRSKALQRNINNIRYHSINTQQKRNKIYSESKYPYLRSNQESHLLMDEYDLVSQLKRDKKTIQKQQTQLPQIQMKNSLRLIKKRSINTSTTKSSMKQNPLLLPGQKKLRLSKRSRRKFKIAVQAIIFAIRLRKRFEKKISMIEDLTCLSQNLGVIIGKTINKYYNDQLKQSLQHFRQIIDRKNIQENKYDSTKDIVQNLVAFTQELKNTSIRKDALKFLTLVTMENFPLPCDFFTDFELLRLNFDSRKFRLKDVNDLQVKMVVGIFLGIKIFCRHLFSDSESINQPNVPTLRSRTISTVSRSYISYFTNIIISFYQNLPTHHQSFLDRLKKKGVRPLNLGLKNTQFYSIIAIEYRRQNIQIINNISIWINRISNQVIKNRYKFKQIY